MFGVFFFFWLWNSYNVKLWIAEMSVTEPSYDFLVECSESILPPCQSNNLVSTQLCLHVQVKQQSFQSKGNFFLSSLMSFVNQNPKLQRACCTEPSWKSSTSVKILCKRKRVGNIFAKFVPQLIRWILSLWSWKPHLNPYASQGKL